MSEHFMHFQGFMAVVAGKCLPFNSGMSKSYLIFSLLSTWTSSYLLFKNRIYIQKFFHKILFQPHELKLKHYCLSNIFCNVFAFTVWYEGNFAAAFFFLHSNTKFIILWRELVQWTRTHWALHRERVEQYSCYPLPVTVLHLDTDLQKWKVSQIRL